MNLTDVQLGLLSNIIINKMENLQTISLNVVTEESKKAIENEINELQVINSIISNELIEN